jgi:hypothetical protein
LLFKISGENTDFIFDNFCSILSVFIFCFSTLTTFSFSLTHTRKVNISFFDFQANFFKVA